MYQITGNLIQKKPPPNYLPKHTKQLHLIWLSDKNISLI